MKRRIGTLVGALLLTAAGMAAQEPAIVRPVVTDRDAVFAPLRPEVAAPACDFERLRGELDPLQRERHEIRRLMRERAEHAALGAPVRRTQPEPTDAPRGMRLAIGNTAPSNWSPYPDKWLDARVIKYPLPRR